MILTPRPYRLARNPDHAISVKNIPISECREIGNGITSLTGRLIRIVCPTVGINSFLDLTSRKKTRPSSPSEYNSRPNLTY